MSDETSSLSSLDSITGTRRGFHLCREKAATILFGKHTLAGICAGFKRGIYSRQRGRAVPIVTASRYIISGYGNRESARFSGASRGLVKRLRKALEVQINEGAPFVCPCGRAATHRGTCTVRFSASTLKQKQMAQIHRRQVGRCRAMS
jgi:hypothetical protein